MSIEKLLPNNLEEANIQVDKMIAGKVETNWDEIKVELNKAILSELNKERFLYLSDMLIKVYEYLCTKQEEDTFTNKNMTMKIRAIAISKFGVSNKSDHLNPLIIINWFFERLKHKSIQDINVKACAWTNLEKQEIIELREIKQMLNTIELMISSLDVNLINKLQPWLELRSKLP